jgi:hypothetical protein
VESVQTAVDTIGQARNDVTWIHSSWKMHDRTRTEESFSAQIKMVPFVAPVMRICCCRRNTRADIGCLGTPPHSPSATVCFMDCIMATLEQSLNNATPQTHSDTVAVDCRSLRPPSSSFLFIYGRVPLRPGSLQLRVVSIIKKELLPLRHSRIRDNAN